MSLEYDRGRSDAATGKDCNPPYRRSDKKAEYKRGYRQGQLDIEEQSTRDKIESMNDDQKKTARQNIQRIKELLQG